MHADDVGACIIDACDAQALDVCPQNDPQFSVIMMNRGVASVKLEAPKDAWSDFTFARNKHLYAINKHEGVSRQCVM